MENIQMLLKQGAVGKPCAPVVAVGDKVKRGQLIATPTGLGVNVHSSVSGEVIEITDDRIIIKPDDEQSEDYVKIAKGSNLEMIKEAGVLGQGGQDSLHLSRSMTARTTSRFSITDTFS